MRIERSTAPESLGIGALLGQKFPKPGGVGSMRQR